MGRALAEKDATIEALNAEKASLNETIKEQGEEILQAQEQFKQMVSTIESELGTEIPVNVSFADEPEAASEVQAEEPAEQAAEPAEELQVAEAPTEEFKEPELDFNQATEEEDEPIEIHPANEKEPDLFASNGGSPTSFFG